MVKADSSSSSLLFSLKVSISLPNSLFALQALIYGLAMEATRAAILSTSAPGSIPSESDSPTLTQQSSKTVLRRHQPTPPHHIPIVVSYKECLKNHAASMGGHALDGCCEFLPSPSSTNTDPTSLKCAACGCHRNFHRRESEDHHSTTSPSHPSTPTLFASNTTADFHPPHPLAQFPPSDSPNSLSPPPISSSCYPSAPHIFLALSNVNSLPRKRFRTKFTQSQKDKMLSFAEKLGWKMQKRDEKMIQRFCSEVKVDRGVLKVWMHNNKSTLSKRIPIDVVVSPGPNGDDEDYSSTKQQAFAFPISETVGNGGSFSSS